MAEADEQAGSGQCMMGGLSTDGGLEVGVVLSLFDDGDGNQSVIRLHQMVLKLKETGIRL